MGSGNRPVLVLTNPHDLTADTVVQALDARGTHVFRCDVADFPLSLTLSATLKEDGWAGELHRPSRPLDLTQVRSVYYRRPGPFKLPERMSDDEHAFADLEARAGFLGVLASLPCRWINHPGRETEATYKPIQLAEAAAAGLRPPASIITNDPNQARNFIVSLGRPALYKGIGLYLAADPAAVPVAATRLVTENEIDDSVRLTAHLFQEFLPKAYEVRVTVVGQRMFAVEIHAGSEAALLDWRTDYDALTYRPTSVPDDIRPRIAVLMNRFGLIFGALDFVVTPESEWRFLEINPNGQWLWLAQETGLPIAEAIADQLMVPQRAMPLRYQAEPK